MIMKQLHPCHVSSRKGFSLIEVVLAIGVFLVTVLALVGLLGPTLKSVDEVEKTDEVSSIVNTINAFLQSSPDIALVGSSKFNSIYNAIQQDGDSATLFVYRWYGADDVVTSNPIVRLEIGFEDNQGGAVNANAVVNTSNVGGAVASFSNAAGPIYRVVLTASSVTPDVYLNETKPNRNSNGIYTLKDPIATYLEGSLAMEVRVFVRDEDMAVINGAMPTPSLADLSVEETVFTYNTAIVR
jgi:type II secretory pathway pseudopilin PulG